MAHVARHLSDDGFTVQLSRVQTWLRAVVVVLVVQFDELLLVFRHLVFGEDGVHRADRFAGSTVDALIGADEELVVTRLRVDAVHGTDIHAGTIHYVHTVLTDDVGHYP